jgi:hypothetical protein
MPKTTHYRYCRAQELVAQLVIERGCKRNLLTSDWPEQPGGWIGWDAVPGRRGH